VKAILRQIDLYSWGVYSGGIFLNNLFKLYKELLIIQMFGAFS